MADESNDGEGNEDSWLYGNSDPKPPGIAEDEVADQPVDELNTEKSNNEQQEETTNPEVEDEHDGNDDPTRAADEMEEQEDDGVANQGNGEMDSDESDDDINVVIGDIKSGPNYNIKQRGTLVAPTAPTQDKPKQPTGKFNIEEFESVGTINGTQTHEFSIDSLDEKPWRKPGADITDYFNYGFNEDTWRSYCERQKRMRVNESGVGLAGLAVNMNAAMAMNTSKFSDNRTLTTLTSDHNKYGPPPGLPTKENVIQVMTADRREYSRPPGKFDPNVPPPFGEEEAYFAEPDPYYNFEPTQDWANNMPMNTGWQPSGIKELTPGPQMLQQPPQMNMPQQMTGPPMRPPMGQMPPHMVGPPMGSMGMNPPRFIPPIHGGPPDQRDRERDRHNDRDRHERDRDRDRDHRDRDRMERDRNDRDRIDRDRDRMDRDRSDRNDRFDRDRDRMRDRDRKSTESERPGRDDDSPPSMRERDRDRSGRSKSDRYRDDRSRRDRDRSRSREKSRRPRSRSRDKDRDKEREKERDKEREKDREKERERERDRNRDKKKTIKKEKEDEE